MWMLYPTCLRPWWMTSTPSSPAWMALMKWAMRLRRRQSLCLLASYRRRLLSWMLNGKTFVNRLLILLFRFGFRLTFIFDSDVSACSCGWICCVFQAYAKKSALKGGLDKTVSLRKDLSEMQEWIMQAEEEFLERDFQYKTPEELRKGVEEIKVCGTSTMTSSSWPTV